MSDKEINPYDWYRNFFERSLKERRNFMNFFTTDLFKEFNQMQEEMEKIYNQFNDVGYNPPKELVREYEAEDGSKVREVGPIVYGYSMTIGPDGHPHIREFGNIKKSRSSHHEGSVNQLDLGASPRIRGEREPLADINMTDKEIKVILEMPGVKKEDIRLDLYGNNLEISTSHGQRNYKRTLEIPSEADVDSARSTYNNGILEITFDKIRSMKSKSREIKID
jgi:HSP20 family protein